MDNLNHYRKIIRGLIEEYAQYKPACGDVQIEIIFDETNDHYELIYAGWNRTYRIHGSVLHIDIRHGKIWIQHDGTEGGIAEELVESGIPHELIVLAFKPPEIRPYTDFAVA
ncbi:XisI protein [bacterium]|nr:XisI protein [bacterium]